MQVVAVRGELFDFGAAAQKVDGRSKVAPRIGVWVGDDCVAADGRQEPKEMVPGHPEDDELGDIEASQGRAVDIVEGVRAEQTLRGIAKARLEGRVCSQERTRDGGRQHHREEREKHEEDWEVAAQHAEGGQEVHVPEEGDGVEEGHEEEDRRIHGRRCVLAQGGEDDCAKGVAHEAQAREPNKPGCVVRRVAQADAPKTEDQLLFPLLDQELEEQERGQDVDQNDRREIRDEARELRRRHVEVARGRGIVREGVGRLKWREPPVAQVIVQTRRRDGVLRGISRGDGLQERGVQRSLQPQRGQAYFDVLALRLKRARVRAVVPELVGKALEVGTPAGLPRGEEHGVLHLSQVVRHELLCPLVGLEAAHVRGAQACVAAQLGNGRADEVARISSGRCVREPHACLRELHRAGLCGRIEHQRHGREVVGVDHQLLVHAWVLEEHERREDLRQQRDGRHQPAASQHKHVFPKQCRELAPPDRDPGRFPRGGHFRPCGLARGQHGVRLDLLDLRLSHLHHLFGLRAGFPSGAQTRAQARRSSCVGEVAAGSSQTRSRAALLRPGHSGGLMGVEGRRRKGQSSAFCVAPRVRQWSDGIAVHAKP
eukprot:scaffold3385_cov241-Pinguiococcus_pyrenoidosus.AAC.2